MSYIYIIIVYISKKFANQSIKLETSKVNVYFKEIISSLQQLILSNQNGIFSLVLYIKIMTLIHLPFLTYWFCLDFILQK